MRNITIHTSQNVPIEYELATSRDRIFAALLDAFVFYLGYYLTVFLLTAFELSSIWLHGFGGVFFLTYFPLFLFLGYHILCDTLIGQTIGKKALGIKVIRLDGNEMSIGDHALRATFYIIDCFITSGFLAIVMVMSTEKAQRLGDMAANTSVIKLRPAGSFSLMDILAISSLENYEPVYPQVVNLKEEDMILVKNIFNRYKTYNNASHQTAVIACVNRLQEVLEIKQIQGDYFSFLNIILKDYIVLTR
jgi:uncharacterized RDD family membrane protein YckC